MFELPIAQLASLTANINRDSKRSPKPFTLEDFALFYERDRSEGFPAQAAMVALSLRREQRMPSVLVGVWPQLIEAAKGGGEMPQTRALISDDNSVALLAPRPEGKHWRGFVLDLLRHVQSALMGKAKAVKPQPLALPHPYMSLESTEICLITKDPQREYKDKLAAAQVERVKVIGIDKLRKKYVEYEAKRNLCSGHAPPPPHHPNPHPFCPSHRAASTSTR